MSKYGHRPHNWFEAIVNKLGGEKEAERFLRGEFQVVETEHVIDLSFGPFVPGDWEIEEHLKGGQFKWKAKQIKLWLAEGQKDGKSFECRKIRQELSDKPVLNANVLDYLLAHPSLIPEYWKGKNVLFWGTIYRDLGGHLYVRLLFWNGDEWDWDAYSLGDTCDQTCFACVARKLELFRVFSL